MSNDAITLTLNKRDTVGKGLNKLRHEGVVPAVIHNHGKDSVIVSGQALELSKAYQKAGKHHPITLKVGDKQYFTLIKDVDFEPKKNQLRHVVFNAIRQDVKTEAEVPIILEGDEIPAEKVGLIIVQPLDHVVIEALPKDLVDSVSIDVTGLTEVGDKIHVSDIKLPAGVEVKNEPEQTIAHVEAPRAVVAEENESEEGAEGEESVETEGESSETKESDSEKSTED